jgi:hypothetical protein
MRDKISMVKTIILLFAILFATSAQAENLGCDMGEGYDPCEQTIIGIIPAEKVELEAGQYKNVLYSYEEVGAAVFDVRRSKNSYILEANDGKQVEVKRDRANFQPYGRLLKEKLLYLTKYWDGKFYAAAGGAGKKLKLPEYYSAELLEVAVKNHELWLKVKFSENICEVQNAKTIGEAWIPAYKNNHTNIWYYAKGC